MCRRVQCDRCQKPTFAGCGMHVEQVLAAVPRDERCSCAQGDKNDKGLGANVMRWVTNR